MTRAGSVSREKRTAASLKSSTSCCAEAIGVSSARDGIGDPVIRRRDRPHRM